MPPARRNVRTEKVSQGTAGAAIAPPRRAPAAAAHAWDPRNPLLRAVLKAPDDDVPRLAYAEWLTTQGDPRGEFIRIQCTLARLPEGDAQRRELERTEARLQTKHEALWRTETVTPDGNGRFVRGFVDEVRLTARDFLKKGAGLFAAAPIRTLGLARCHGLLAEVAGSSLLRRLAAFDLASSGIDEADVRALVESPNLGGLKRLCLDSNSLGDEGLRALAAGSGLRGLRTLEASNARIGDDGVGALAASAGFPKLVAIVLRRNRIGDEGLRELAASRRLAGLETLDLAANRITDGGVKALASLPYLKSLARLDLSHNKIGDEGVMALASCPTLASLAELALDTGRVGDEGLAAIAASRHLTHLRALEVRGPFGDEGALALAASDHLPSLARVRLSGEELSKKARTALRRRFGAGFLEGKVKEAARD